MPTVTNPWTKTKKRCPKCQSNDIYPTWVGPVDSVKEEKVVVNKCNTCGHEFDTIERGSRFKPKTLFI